jgi:acetoin utilization deacetylase AcuC-like enzyme
LPILQEAFFLSGETANIRYHRAMIRVAWSPLYAHPLPEGHRFPMQKYNLVPETLLAEGSLKPEQLFEPQPMAEEVLLRSHDAAYWHRLKTGTLSPAEVRRSGFPWSSQLVQRELVISQGTLDGARFALQHGRALNVSGGTHHAGIAFAEGFCLLNDIAMAANELLHTGEVSHVLVVDLDVHQGNGTAQMLADEPRAFTFSMHCDHNFPLVKERSDLDIPLPPGTGDDEYLSILRDVLPPLLDRQRPDLVFYLSGVDVLATDKLGKLNLSMQGCLERDRIVWAETAQRGIPVVASMGGGYSADVGLVVQAHCNTFRAAFGLL